MSARRRCGGARASARREQRVGAVLHTYSRAPPPSNAAAFSQKPSPSHAGRARLVFQASVPAPAGADDSYQTAAFTTHLMEGAAAFRLPTRPYRTEAVGASLRSRTLRFRDSTVASIRASNSARRRRAPHLLCRGSARRPYRAEAFAVAAAASSSLPGLDAGTARERTVRTSAALLHTSPGNRGRAGRLYRAEAVAVAAVAARRRRGQRWTRRGRARVVDLHRRSMGAACAARTGGVPLGAMIHGRRRAHAGRRFHGSASARRALVAVLA